MWHFIDSGEFKSDFLNSKCYSNLYIFSRHLKIYPGGLKWKPYEPTAKERRQAAQIQKNQDDRQQKKR